LDDVDDRSCSCRVIMLVVGDVVQNRMDRSDDNNLNRYSIVYHDS